MIQSFWYVTDRNLSLFPSPPHRGTKFRLNSWNIYQGYKILSTWGGYSGQVLWSLFIRLLSMYVKWVAGHVMNRENNGEDRSRYTILEVICIWIIFGAMELMKSPGRMYKPAMRRCLMSRRSQQHWERAEKESSKKTEQFWALRKNQ